MFRNRSGTNREIYERYNQVKYWYNNEGVHLKQRGYAYWAFSHLNSFFIGCAPYLHPPKRQMHPPKS